VRERDVSLSLLAEIEREHRDVGPAARLVRQSIRAERREARLAAAAYLEARTLQDLVRKIERVVGKDVPGESAPGDSARSPDADWRLVIAVRVVRRARQLEDAVEHAGALYAADRLHRVRVSAKKLRYALELGHEARLRRWDSAVRSLKQIQDGLGALQDCETLLGHVRSVSAARPTDESLDRLTRPLEQEAREHHARYLRQRNRLLKLCARVRRQASEILPLGPSGPRSLPAGSAAPPDERAPDGAEPLAWTNSP
jgi:CHAD domain-containing protein